MGIKTKVILSCLTIQMLGILLRFYLVIVQVMVLVMRKLRRLIPLRCVLLIVGSILIYLLVTLLMYSVRTSSGLSVFSQPYFGERLQFEDTQCTSAKTADKKGEMFLTSEATLVWPKQKIDIYSWSADDFCISNIKDVYWHPLFPKYPDEINSKQSITDNNVLDNFAVQRFIFFFRPEATGKYQLSLGLQGGIDFYISSYESRPNQKMKKTCYHTYKYSVQFVSFTTMQLYFETAKVYLFDLIHFKTSKGRLVLSWKPPNYRYFHVMEGNMFYGFSSNNYTRGNTTLLDEDILQSPVQMLPSINQTITDLRVQFFRRKQVLFNELANLDTCSYTQTYLANQTVALYHGYLMVKEGRSYPDVHVIKLENFQNITLKETTAISIKEEIANLLIHTKHTSNKYYEVENIAFMEQNPERLLGYRYFVELDIREKISNTTLRLTDYFYKQNIKKALCLPRGYRWKKNTLINIILTTSRNQRKWTLLTLDNIAKIANVTFDRNIHVIVAAFSSNDINFDIEFNKRNLNFTVIHLPGRFNKVKGINKAVNIIMDPKSIVFTIDLHLQFPLFILDEVRKNTIYKKTVYAPVLIRLPCGKHCDYTDDKGAFWVKNGFGILGMYKADWDIIGGMDEERFGEKWGGEDWELVDRIVSKRYEVIQRRLPGYYHIYHSRKESAWYG